LSQLNLFTENGNTARIGKWNLKDNFIEILRSKKWVFSKNANAGKSAK